MIPIWMGLNLLDGVSTYHLLKGGFGREINFLWMGISNFQSLIGLKVLGAVVVVLLLWYIKKMKLLKVLNICMGVVVVWNLTWVVLSWI